MRIQRNGLLLIGILILVVVFVLSRGNSSAPDVPLHIKAAIGTFPGSQQDVKISLPNNDPNKQWIVANIDCGVSSGYLNIGEVTILPDTKEVLSGRELDGKSASTTKLDKDTQTSCAEMLIVEYTDRFAAYSIPELEAKINPKP